MIRPDQLTVGTEFATPFEAGCVVTQEPDPRGEFLARDSDGVECAYSVDMVAYVVYAIARPYRSRTAEYRGGVAP